MMINDKPIYRNFIGGSDDQPIHSRYHDLSDFGIEPDELTRPSKRSLKRKKKAAAKKAAAKAASEMVQHH